VRGALCSHWWRVFHISLLFFFFKSIWFWKEGGWGYNKLICFSKLGDD
jgi:hypothetical protein